MHSEGILAGEIKHGPLALVDENMPILVIATKDRMYSKMHSVIQQLRARNARLIVVCNQGDADIAALVSPRCTLIEVLHPPPPPPPPPPPLQPHQSEASSRCPFPPKLGDCYHGVEFVENLYQFLHG